MLFTSTLMLFLDPKVSLTIGILSAAGVGIAVEPSQVIPVAFALFLALGYFTLAFWLSTLTESGTNVEIAHAISALDLDPSYDVDMPPQSVEEHVKQNARKRIDR